MLKPSQSNWATVKTAGSSPPVDEAHLEPEMEPRLKVLKARWAFEPPDEELSIVVADGELVYVARYAEGIVLRVNDKRKHITFLTHAMAAAVGEAMSQKG